MAAVHHTQIALGMGDPHMGEMSQLEYVVKGLKRQPGRPTCTRLPITPEILHCLKQIWRTWPEQRDASMLWAAACTYFSGFLRAGEIVVPSDSEFDPAVHLCYGDVHVDSVSASWYIEVRVKASKTDPFRTGVSVFLRTGVGKLRPVSAVLNYMVRRSSAAGQFFTFADGKRLTR